MTIGRCLSPQEFVFFCFLSSTTHEIKHWFVFIGRFLSSKGSFHSLLPCPYQQFLSTKLNNPCHSCIPSNYALIPSQMPHPYYLQQRLFPPKCHALIPSNNALIPSQRQRPDSLLQCPYSLTNETPLFPSSNNALIPSINALIPCQMQHPDSLPNATLLVPFAHIQPSPFPIVTPYRSVLLFLNKL